MLRKKFNIELLLFIYLFFFFFFLKKIKKKKKKDNNKIKNYLSSGGTKPEVNIMV